MNVVFTLTGPKEKEAQKVKEAVFAALNKDNSVGGVQKSNISTSAVADGVKVVIYTLGRTMSSEVQTRLKPLNGFYEAVKSMSPNAEIKFSAFDDAKDSGQQKKKFQFKFKVTGLGNTMPALPKVEGSMKQMALQIMGEDVKADDV